MVSDAEHGFLRFQEEVNAAFQPDRAVAAGEQQKMMNNSAHKMLYARNSEST